jgi:L-alanine-DL-glutamate epimerase-like enolase superfamily enzyme
MNRCPWLFVRLDPDAGITGLGETAGDEMLLEAMIERRLEPMAVGPDPRDVEKLWEKLYASGAFWEPAGSVVGGISAIEVAGWDIRGQVEGAPAYGEAAPRHGTAVSPHNYAGREGLAATLRFMAALPQALLRAFDPTGTAIYGELFIAPLSVKDGHVQVPTTPGLGVQLMDETIARHR